MYETADNAPLFPDPRQRPMSLDWASDDLIRYTQDVWSEFTGKPISVDDAIEILTNVKRLVEVLMNIERDRAKDEREKDDPHR
jgi:hypothetical protein